ncbi:glycine/betaine ABC transporter substrate-binding protein [Acidiphilium sp. AL]|uniref:glycine betaine ABC transporter substrate-binding protein n=1 Tax=Acidiphilium sp. AL TaxID=2871704 RepID=UPI0021CB58BF|nr:glycine betaine ABC transporter substrate-binding protein [Acidiphilium sp. AL]MCU4160173.1 glycine/betaine ABC transporter substrate-binding protein [Acidiphilium sp. AL]
MPRQYRTLVWLGAINVAMLITVTARADPASCKVVKMGQPSWTDIRVTDALAGTVLDAIGYHQKIEHLAVPIIYQALKNQQIDVFQGNWMPAQKHFVKSYQGGFERLGTNLSGAKFTLAVPEYVAAAGVHNISDLNKHAAKFDHKIYGIGPGAPADQNIRKMIAANADGLKGWKLVASSEVGMLSEVSRDVARRRWIAFLAWEPNPMNVRYHITYLKGGAAYFGPHYGQATVYTLGRPGFSRQCPNLAHLFGQLKFNVAMENLMMVPVAKGKVSAKHEAVDYLKQHPQLLQSWLKGVKTASGQKALPAAEQALGIK